MSSTWRLLGPLEAANGTLDVRRFRRDDFYPRSTAGSRQGLWISKTEGLYSANSAALLSKLARDSRRTSCAG
jgi:hypothetical protein